MSRNRSAARRLLLRSLLTEEVFSSQDEIRDRLAAKGYPVTQTTVSRDLSELGVRKVQDDSGREIYRPMDQPATAAHRQLADRLREFADTIRPSGNLVIVRTPPGAASTVAAALDAAALDGLLGSVAGDDTVLLVAPPDGGSELAATLLHILEG